MIPPIPTKTILKSPLLIILTVLVVVSAWGGGVDAGAQAATSDEIDFEETYENISTIKEKTITESETNDSLYQDSDLGFENQKRITVFSIKAIMNIYGVMLFKPMLNGMVWGYEHPNLGSVVGPIAAWGPFVAVAYIGYKSLKELYRKLTGWG